MIRKLFHFHLPLSYRTLLAHRLRLPYNSLIFWFSDENGAETLYNRIGGGRRQPGLCPTGSLPTEIKYQEEQYMTHLYDSRILIVDDNGDILKMLRNILSRKGFQSIETASCCSEATEVFRAFRPELVILDVMLPDGDGFSLMREFRMSSDVPVLFLSAKDEDNDRLFGLGLGADDYITKPFLPDELVLRLTAILKRTYFSTLRQEAPSQELKLGPRTISLESGMVKKDGQETALTAKELAILKKLSENRGNIVTFDALSDAVWGENYYGYENTLMVHIRRLREKIEENPSHPQWLLTIRGLGYKLVKGGTPPV